MNVLGVFLNKWCYLVLRVVCSWILEHFLFLLQCNLTKAIHLVQTPKSSLYDATKGKNKYPNIIMILCSDFFWDKK